MLRHEASLGADTKGKERVNLLEEEEEEEEQNDATPLLRHAPPAAAKSTRWVILVLTSLMLAGQFFVYDNPAAMAPDLAAFLGLQPDQAAYLVSACYAVYAFPNILLPFLGGLALDKYGLRSVMLFSVLAVLIGQVIFSIGLSVPRWAALRNDAVHEVDHAVLLLGRAVMGAGGEILGVVATRIVTLYFADGSSLALALALLLSLARIGSVLNANGTSMLSSEVGVDIAAWCGVACMVLSTLSAIAVSALLRREEGQRITIVAPPIDHSGYGEQLRRLWQRTIKPLPASFWYLAALGTLLYSAILPFINIANGFLRQTWFPQDDRLAGLAMGLPDTLSLLLVPLLGLLLLHSPRYTLPLCLASLFIFVAHLLLLLPLLQERAQMQWLYAISPFGPLLILGAGYSLYGVALWPAIAGSVSDPVSPPLALLASPSHDRIERSLHETPVAPLSRFQSQSSFSFPILRSVPLPPHLTSRQRSHRGGISGIDIDASDEEDDEVQSDQGTSTASFFPVTWSKEVRQEKSQELMQAASEPDYVSIAYGLVTSLINLALTVMPLLIAKGINRYGYIGAECILLGVSGAAVAVSLLYIFAHLTTQ